MLRSRIALLVPVLSLLVAACDGANTSGGGGAGGSTATDPLPAPAEEEGTQIAMETTVKSGEEAWRCKVSELPFTSFTAVNHVESVQSEGMHHMDIMTLAFVNEDIAVGEYDCQELYDKYDALMEDGVILYAAQQPKQEILMPEGVVANLPGNMRIMQEIHYVNTSAEDKTVFSKVNVYVYPSENVEHQIWGGAVRDANLTIPPMAKHTEWSRCVMNKDVNLIFLASHTHRLGRKVTVRTFDGTSTGDEIYVNTDWETPQLKSFTDAPLFVPKGQGFEVTCDFQNDTPDEVHWGFAASDEMCQIGIVYFPGDLSSDCTIVETSDGVLPN
ncbi:MAG: hypothetical protein R3B70_08585 [Polyangiaceae bacterium]